MTIRDRIRTTTTQTGTLTTISVGATPPTGFQKPSARFSVNDADIPVVVAHQTADEWQVCWCTYSSADTFTVNSVIYSSNSDNAVSFSSGTKDVFVVNSSASVGGLREVNTWTKNQIFQNTGLKLLDTGSDHTLTIKPNENLAADRTLNVVVGAADRTLTFAGNATVGRTITGTAPIAVTNGDGVSGNPTISVSNIADADISASAAIDPLKVKYQRDGAGLTRTVDAKLKDLMPNTRDYLFGGNLPFGGFAAFSLLPTVTSNNTWYYDNTAPQSNVTLWHKIPNTVSQTSGTVEGIALNFDSEISTATPGTTLAEQNTLRMRTKVLGDAGKHLHYHTINIVGEFSHDIYDASRAAPNEAGAVLATYVAKGPTAGGTKQAIGVWGGDLHVAKDAGVANGSMVGLEVGVHTQVNQSYVGDNSVGRVVGVNIWSGARNYTAGTTYAGHDGLRIDGDSGWTNFIRCRHTDNTTEIFKLEGTGLTTMRSPANNMVVTAEALANTRSAQFLASGRTSGGAQVNTLLLSSDGGVGIVGTTTNHGLNLRTNNTDAIFITTSGTVGINTGANTPTARLDVRGNVVATNGTNGVLLVHDGGAIDLTRSDGNAFIDFRTSTSEDFDCRIQQQSNGLAFFTGGDTTTAEKVRITSSAQAELLVGTTAASFGDTGRGNINIYGSSDTILVMKTAQDNFYIYANATDSTINNMRNGALIFSTNNAEAARITSDKHLNLNSATSEYRVNGTKVVTSRRTGWAAATGTATRTTFATTTVTTEQLAERVKALIDDLTTHGLIGT